MNPVRYEGDTPLFLSSQTQEYGPPEFYGYERYMIISDDQTLMVPEYSGRGVERRLRPIHRYCRTSRFSAILSRLTQMRGNVAVEVAEEYLDKYGVLLSWNKIRDFLKCTGRAYLYNLIPEFINQINLLIPAYMHSLGLPANLLPENLAVIAFDMTPQVYREIVEEFRSISLNFELVITERKYFPSIRFIAFKLLQQRGAIFNGVPFMRTRKKEMALEELWNKIKLVYFRVPQFFGEGLVFDPGVPVFDPAVPVLPQSGVE